MTTGDHKMPPHLERYVDAATDASHRLTITPGYDVAQYLEGRQEPAPEVAQGRTADAAHVAVPDGAARDVYVGVTRHAARTEPGTANPAPEAIQPDGHVDPAAAGRWHQAQTELVELIHAEGRTLAADPQAAPVLPDELGPWMEQRVAELAEPEIG
ncbi:MAG TPA: hypothetical protein VFE59_26215 [Trebonia sp.]|jgi:hypothetical protein|nr:hypothetical protein [Trebonia sp.]